MTNIGNLNHSFASIFIGALKLQQAGEADVTLRMGKADSSNLGRLWSVAAMLLALGCVVRAEAIPEIETAKGLARAIMLKQFPELEGKKGLRPDLLQSYDLGGASHEAMNGITSRPDFAAFLERKEKALDPEELKNLDRKTRTLWLLEYVQSREELKPEIKAWLEVWAYPYVPWDQALAAYHRLQKLRPNDFVPALILAVKLGASGLDPPTRAQWSDLVEIEQQALPHATNTEDWVDCVDAVGLGATKLAQTEKGQEVPLQQVWQWMRGLRLPASANSNDALAMDVVKVAVALAANDFPAAAEIASRCRMRISLPIYLVLGGKKEEGYALFEKLSHDPTLTDSEREGLRQFEPMVLTFSDHFDQARRVINEGRASPNVAAQQWLDVMERLLHGYEARIRSSAHESEHRIWMDVTIHDQPVHLAFDTGAEGSVLFRSTADRLKLKLLDSPLKATSGLATNQVTELCQFKLGTLLAPIQFLVVNLPARAKTQADGVMSWNPFRNNVIVFDVTEAVTIDDEIPPGALNWPKFKQVASSDKLAFDADGQDARQGIIYVDTGDPEGVALSHSLWQKWITAHGRQPRTLSSGYSLTSGMLIEPEVWADYISIGGLTLANVPVRECDPKLEADFPNLAAILGLYALTRLDFVLDGENGTVYARTRGDAPRPYEHNRLGAVFDPKDDAHDELFAHVAACSPADLAGIRDGDVLLKVDDLDVTRWRSDPEFGRHDFWRAPPGTSYKLTLRREDREYETAVTLKEILGCATPIGAKAP